MMITDISDKMKEIKDYAKANKISIQDACALFQTASTLELHDAAGCMYSRITDAFNGKGAMSIGIFNEEGHAFSVVSSVDVNVEGSLAVGDD